jgi:hypothetical protein
MSITFHLETDGQTKLLTKKANVLFKHILTINKITRTTGSLKQKL